MTDLHALIALARRTPNRGRTHMFLGDPLSDGCDKTTVEPGNTYSPGVWTCGVSLWFRTGQDWVTPDLLAPDDISWSFIAEPGGAPLVEARYRADALSVRHSLCHLGDSGARGVDYNSVELTAAAACAAAVAIVVRDVGPAGGKIDALDWDGGTQTLTVNGSLRLTVEEAVEECRVAPADEEWDSPAAALALSVELPARETRRIAFTTAHGFDDPPFSEELGTCEAPEALAVPEAFERAGRQWAEALPARVFCPDPRVALTWERSAAHILAAMECGLPRIGAVNYPVLWIRDCVIVLRAIDLIGRHDLARAGCDYLAPLYFGGGFGAESDAPGEGIWALVRHAQITGDDEWLAGHFHHVRRRAECLESMLNAAEPLRALCESRDPRCINTPSANLLCLPARNGLIHGRMDGHSPDFYINCWAQCGLRLAAWTARRVGADHEAERWARMAERLDERIRRHLLPGYGNPRDAIVTPYPTGALAEAREELGEEFAEWYRRNRLNPDGSRRPEPRWTYFEAAQAHNALLLGLREEAWTTVKGMLASEGPWDVSAYGEGEPGGGECLPYRNDLGRRGWLHPERAEAANMPHNWTSAELINALRDLFVVERRGRLVLGVGVPAAWIQPGARFGVHNMPTDRGTVSYEAVVRRDGRVEVAYEGPAEWEAALPGAVDGGT